MNQTFGTPAVSVDPQLGDSVRVWLRPQEGDQVFPIIVEGRLVENDEAWVVLNDPRGRMSMLDAREVAHIERA